MRRVFRRRVIALRSISMRRAWVVMLVVAGCYASGKRQEAPGTAGAVQLGGGGDAGHSQDAISVSAPRKLSPPPGQWGGRYPDAAAEGDRVAVVWLQSHTATDACVVGSWLGTKRADRIEVGCGSINGAPVIAAGGSAPLVVWSERDGIVGALLGTDHAKRVFTQSPSSGTRKLAVGWDGERYVVAWSDQREIYGMLVGADGTPLGPPQNLRPAAYPHTGFLQGLQMWCEPTRCTLAYSGTDGYNKPSYATLAIERGVPATWGGSDPPSKLLLPKLFASRWYTEPALEGAEPDRNKLRGVETPHGSVVAWEHERTVRLAYIPADPELRRFPALVLDAHEPIVVAQGNARFVLVTVSRDHYVEARTIDIDPVQYSALPAKRPPAVTGVVLDARGRPAAGAGVQLELHYAGGNQTRINTHTGSDGTFALAHPYERQLEETYDVTTASGWAHRGEHVSAIETGTKLRLRLREPAQLAVKLVGATSDVTLEVRVYSPDSTSNYRHALWTKQLTTRSSFEVSPIPAGRVELTATTPGITARASAELRPGKRTVVLVKLPARPRTPLDLAK